MSQAGPRIGQAAGRRQTEAFWSLATFLINGALFILVGLEAQSVARDLASTDLATAAITVAAITAVVIGVRFAFLFTSPTSSASSTAAPSSESAAWDPGPASSAP